MFTKVPYYMTLSEGLTYVLGPGIYNSFEKEVWKKNSKWDETEDEVETSICNFWQ